MTKEQFNREMNYGAVMAIARVMLSQRLINNKDYRKIDTIIKKKYRPVIGCETIKIP